MARIIEGNTKQGLRYLLLPQGIFEEKMAAILVKHGANALFWKDAQDNAVAFPAGTAHFIEHRLFRQHWGDAFAKLTQNGTAVNAFTNAEQTVYYFRCREKFMENLQILLDFVQHPFFPPAEIEREKEIICSEIAMYADDPDWVCYVQLLDGMYATHPVRNPIAGTPESVHRITPEILHCAYDAYYTTDAMTLICTGNLPVRQVLQAAELVAARKGVLSPVLPQEPAAIQEKYRAQKMGLRQPCFQIGWKLPAPASGIRRQIGMGLLLELAAGESSHFYRKAYEKELLDAPLASDYHSGAGYAFAVFSGKGRQPEAVAELLCAAWERLRKKGISAADFSRIQRKMLGGFLRQLDSVEGLCMGQIAWEQLQAPASEVLHGIKSAEKAELEGLLDGFSAKQMVLSVVQ